MPLLFAILLVLLFVAIIVTYKFIAITRVKIPEAPHKIITGIKNVNSSDAHAIPRIIWSYWHELPLPNFVTLCHNNWQQHAPDHEIRILNKNTIGEWISADKIPDYFYALPPYRQADWLRLQLLATYGGIWVDASIIMTRNLNWLHEIQQQENSEYVGFYINLYTNRPDKPIIENWFMAATMGSCFIRDLALEFNRAIQLGESVYLKEIIEKGKFTDIIQLIAPAKMQQYLIMHVAASVLLDKDNGRYRLALFRAEDTAFVFHSLLHWSKRTLHFKLTLTPCPKKLPFFIKLRGGERERAERYLAKGWYYRGSLLAKFLKL